MDLASTLDLYIDDVGIATERQTTQTYNLTLSSTSGGTTTPESGTHSLISGITKRVCYSK